jgi:hypothetical protein
MSEPPESRRVPLMPAEKARGIARSCKFLADEYADVGMARQAANMLRECNWWMGYAISLAQSEAQDGGTPE